MVIAVPVNRCRVHQRCTTCLMHGCLPCGHHELVKDRGRPLDRSTQVWLRTTGTRVQLSEYPWLGGPVGDPELIGDEWLGRETHRLGGTVRKKLASRTSHDGTGGAVNSPGGDRRHHRRRTGRHPPRPREPGARPVTARETGAGDPSRSCAGSPDRSTSSRG